MSTSPQLEHLEHIRRSTAEHTYRRGLYMVVLGLFVGALALDEFRETPVVPVLLGAVLLAATAGYYRRNFGAVVPQRRFRGLPNWLNATISVVILLVLLFVLVPAGIAFALAVGTDRYIVGGLLFAALLALTSLPHWRQRAHYLVSAALLAVITVIPFGEFLPGGVHPLAIEEYLVLLLLMAALFIVNGLIDHRALVRSFGEVAGDEGQAA